MDIEDAKQTISDLFERIIEIKTKAVQSEELVQVICKCVISVLLPLETFPSWTQPSVT